MHKLLCDFPPGFLDSQYDLRHAMVKELNMVAPMTLHVEYLLPEKGEGKPDSFYQTSLIYIIKGNKTYALTDKNDLFEILKKNKTEIRDFMKKNKLRVSKKEPESFVPLIRYYDSLSR